MAGLAALVDFDGNYTRLMRGARAAGARAGDQAGNGFATSFGRHSSRLGNTLRSALGKAAVVGTAVVGAGVVAGFAGAVAAAASFEKRMSGVGAVSNATGREMAQLRAKALQLGADTKYSASEAALAMEELVKAGVSVPDVLNGASDAVVALAAAGEVELPEAAAIAANAMNLFNLSGEQASKVADLIAGSANASSIDVSDFGLSMAQVGTVANLVGLSIDDAAVAITAMGNAGIKGSDSGTSLKTMFTRLNPATAEATEEMRRLGIITEDGSNRFYDSEGNMKSLSGVAGVLKGSLAGMTAEQKQAALTTIFGSDAIRAATVIAEEGADGIAGLTTEIGKISAEDVAEKRMDNLAGSIEKFKGSLDTLLISTGSPFLGFLRGIVDWGTRALNLLAAPPAGLIAWLSNFQSLFDLFRDGEGTSLRFAAWVDRIVGGTGRTVVPLAHLYDAFARLYEIGGTVVEWVQRNLEPVLVGLGAAAAALLAPVALGGIAAVLGTIVTVIASPIAWIGVLAGAFYAAYTRSEEFRTRVDAIAATLREGLGAALSWLAQTIPSVIDSVVTVATSIGRTLAGIDWGGAWSRLVDTFTTVFGVLREIALPVLGAIAAVAANVAAGLVASGIASAIGGIATAFAFLANPVTLVVAAIAAVGFGLTWLYQNVEPVRNAMNALGSAVMELVRSVGSLLAPALDLVMALFRSIQPVFAALAPVGRVIATVLGGALVGAFYLVAGAVRVWAAYISTIANVVLPALTWVISNVVAPVIAFLANLVGTVLTRYFQILGQVATAMWSALSAAVSAAWGFLQPIFTALWSFLGSVLAPVFRLVGSVAAAVWSGITAAVTAAWGWVQPIFAAIWGWITRNLVPVFQTIGRVVASVWSGIQSAITAVWGWVQPIFAAIASWVGDRLVALFRRLQADVALVWSAISSAISSAWAFVQPIFSTVATWVGDTLVAHLNTLKTVAETVWSGIHTAISGAWDLIEPVLQGVVDFVNDPLLGVWETLSSAVGTAFDAIPGAIGSALGLAGDAVAGFLRGAAGIADGVGLDAIADGLRSAATSADGWGEGFARGGPVRGGIWGRDSVPAMLMPGEFVQRTSSVQRWGTGAMDSLNRGQVPAGWSIPGYGDGGLVGDIAGAAGDAWDATGGKVVSTVTDKLQDIAGGALERIWPELPWGPMQVPVSGLLGILPGGINHVRAKVIDFIKGEAEAKQDAIGSPPPGGWIGNAVNAASWISEAMALTGVPAWWFDPLMHRAQLESGFNPRAINLWDSNAAKGIPSKGLMQTIQPTFDAYALPGMNDVWHPVHNAVAAIRYILARYGDISNTNPNTGYATGGLVDPVTFHRRSFDTGGILEPGWNVVKNMTGDKEVLRRDTGGIGDRPLLGEVHLHDDASIDHLLQGVTTRVRMGAI